MAERDIRPRRWGRTVGAAITGASLVFGGPACASSRDATPSFSDGSPGATDQLNLGKLYWDLPQGPCKPYSLRAIDPDPAKIKQAAEACVEARKDLDVALVDFGTNADVAQVEKSMEEYVQLGSDGLLAPDVTVIPATHEAKEEHKAMSEKTGGCVDSYDPTNFASFTAARTMRDTLDSYDMVVALSPIASCEEAEGGVADKQGRRYADIFVGSNLERLKNPATVQGQIGAHEWLHLAGLIHSGTVYGKAEIGFSPLYFFPDSYSPNPVDLKKFFSEVHYQEYDDPKNIMGSYLFSSRDYPPTANAIQTDEIRWPEATINGPEVLDGKVVGSEWTTITNEAARQHDYGKVQLTEPITFTIKRELPDGRTINDERQFDTLAFVPIMDGDPQKGSVVGAYLYLTDTKHQQGQVISFGTLFTDGNNPWRIQQGTQIIEVRGKNNLQLRIMQAR